MQEDDTGGAKKNVIQAIQMGVVDVVKVPLVKHSMRTLWQHSVRKMMVGQNGAEPSGRMVRRCRLTSHVDPVLKALGFQTLELLESEALSKL